MQILISYLWNVNLLTVSDFHEKIQYGFMFSKKKIKEQNFKVFLLNHSTKNLVRKIYFLFIKCKLVSSFIIFKEDTIWFPKYNKYKSLKFLF